MKIICVGRNYIDHAKELNNPVPKNPLLFHKPSTSILNNNKPFYIPEWTENIHYEAELVLKISKHGKYIDEEFARNYYDEIALGIDFTARDIQGELKQKGHPWEISKAFDHSAPVSSFVSLDSLPNKNEIHFTLKKNSEIVQSGNSRDMIFSFDYLISYMSRYFTLHIGDYIFTGTPAGVGKVESGDLLAGYIEGKELLKCKIH